MEITGQNAMRSSAKLRGHESGVADFPALTNYWNQLRIQVTSSESVLHPEDAVHALKLVGMRDGDKHGPEAEKQACGVALTIWLRGMWHDTPARQGTILRLIDPRRLSSGVYEISDKHGIVIVEPETLISCTSLAQALWCERRAVLQERFRSLAPPTMPLILGTVVHELFQSALRERPSPLNRDWLLATFRSTLLPQFESDLAALEETAESFEQRLQPYLENVCDWMSSHYPAPAPRNFATAVNGHVKNAENARRRGPPQVIPSPQFSFDQVADIEENIWTPTIGIKGRIDVSFKKANPDAMDGNHRLALELKTGKSYDLSIEHQAQVLLYSLMLSERANAGRILPGLVLYLKDNTLREIEPKTVELRGVLHLRNRLAPHFHAISLESFPAPLHSARFCPSCPYALTCAVVDKCASACEEEKENDQAGGMISADYSVSAEMRAFLDSQLSHLSKEQLESAKESLHNVFTEWRDAKRGGAGERLFRMSPTKREASGSCIADMHYESWEESAGMFDGSRIYKLRFARRDSPASQFKPGDVVTISQGRAFALLIATVQAIDGGSVTVLSDKRLPDVHQSRPSIGQKRGRAECRLYHLDRVERFSQFYERLAKIIGDLQPKETPSNAGAEEAVSPSKQPD